MATDDTRGPGSRHGDGWEPVGTSGHFARTRLPLSDDALTLNRGEPLYLYFGEFNTGPEAEAWKAYVYDPLRVLIAEGIIEADESSDDAAESKRGKGRGHHNLQIEIVKLAGPESEDAELEAHLRKLGDQAARLYESTQVDDAVRDEWSVTTSVSYHERGLNPRIGLTSFIR